MEESSELPSAQHVTCIRLHMDLPYIDWVSIAWISNCGLVAFILVHLMVCKLKAEESLS